MISWSNKEHKLSVKVEDNIWDKILAHCNEFYPKECGGVLVGSYDKDLKNSFVKDIYFSKKSKFWMFNFLRESQETNKYLKQLWGKSSSEVYFVGEWHSHPNGNSMPSSRDDKTLFKIAKSKTCQCSRPILLILSGNAEDGWNAEYVWVYTAEVEKLKLDMEKQKSN